MEKKIMSKERAEGIQRTLLNDITDIIPARLVDPFWETYQQEVGRIKSRPCTCTPKYWLQMVEELKTAVAESLAYHNAEVPTKSETAPIEEIIEETEVKKKK